MIRDCAGALCILMSIVGSSETSEKCAVARGLDFDASLGSHFPRGGAAASEPAGAQQHAPGALSAVVKGRLLPQPSKMP